VGRTDAEGSRRLILRAVQKASSARVGPAEAGRRRGLLWTPEEVRLLGRLPDGEVAARAGRSLEAVRWKRRGLGRTNPGGRKVPGR
jgi:hypothetical protein